MKSRPSESPVRHGKSRAGHLGDAGSEAVLDPASDALALPHTDWLRHELVIIGPASQVAEFAAAAAGPGGIPWAYPELDYEEDDRYLALVNPPDGSQGLRPAAARILARELREAVFQHQGKVRALAGVSRLCPLDLHALIPIPAHLLDLGPDDTNTLAWLCAHWGVVRALRHVRLIATGCKKLRGKNEQLSLEFWSADWTPWPAIVALRQRFAGLSFSVTPDYEGG
jgi:hypothetical protein